MMMNSNHIKTIADLVAALRPGWDVQGIRAALMKVTELDPFDVADTAIRLARDSANRTPAVIAMQGNYRVTSSSASGVDRRRREAAARDAAISECEWCDENGYRLPAARAVCGHVAPRKHLVGSYDVEGL